MSTGDGIRRSPIIDDDEPKSSGSEAKRSRYSSSSEDDDAYSNFDKMFQKNQKKFKKIEASHLRLHVTQPKKAPSPKLDVSTDSGDDFEIEDEKEDQNTLAALMKKGKKFNEEREKNLDAEMIRIQELAKVDEAEVGALPNMIYSDSNAKEAEIRLQRLKEDRRVAMQRRASLDTVDCVVIDGSGEYTERDYGSHGRAHQRLSGIKVTFLLQDLHLNDTKIEKMDYNLPMRSLVDRVSKRWECDEADVMLTLTNDDTIISDLSQTPKDLNVALDGIHTISAVYVPSKKADKPAARDANAITIKFQSGQGKPAMIDIDKTAPFSDVLDRVATALKMEHVAKLVFDCEKIDFSSTPEELDMDDEDCVDVYAA